MLAMKHVPASPLHYVWDRTVPPVLEVQNGEQFTVATREASDRQLKLGTSPRRLREIDFGGFWPLSGPIAVVGAKPGDGLEVEMVKLQPGEWGWSAVFPERGLLREDFRAPYLHHWELEPDAETARLRPGINVPLRPFLGVAGCALATSGTSSPLPPRPVGGKLDLPLLTEGARLVLPVQVPGALLSVGHGRAAQGDGEICGSGIETDMLATLRVRLIAGGAPESPRTMLPQRPPLPQPARIAMTGIGADLLSATKQAARELIGWLRSEHRLSKELAYILCSVAAETRIAQVVNTPNWTVTMSLPLDMFAR